jgi:hypothetical protein
LLILFAVDQNSYAEVRGDGRMDENAITDERILTIGKLELMSEFGVGSPYFIIVIKGI